MDVIGLRCGPLFLLLLKTFVSQTDVHQSFLPPQTDDVTAQAHLPRWKPDTPLLTANQRLVYT